MERALIIARVEPDAKRGAAEVFVEPDRAGMPGIVGLAYCRHRWHAPVTFPGRHR